ncbi:hypothetical protein ILUMI_24245 [Ignelater luminosus]|uniref:Uncharacterized protein n=1 Tax=Ignelater luminosus TaxID=2038154 RepID=A0A8K0C6M0_IGNLU|nr:hypothetical protein ILUMI_24245 [Ignelater luminosus]
MTKEDWETQTLKQIAGDERKKNNKNRIPKVKINGREWKWNREEEILKLTKLTNGYWIYWFGVNTKENAKSGVALLKKDEKIRHVENEKMINGRLILINIKGKENEKYILVVRYGPNEDTRKEEKDKFLGELQETLDTTKK